MRADSIYIECCAGWIYASGYILSFNVYEFGHILLNNTKTNGEHLKRVHEYIRDAQKVQLHMVS